MIDIEVLFFVSFSIKLRRNPNKFARDIMKVYLSERLSHKTGLCKATGFMLLFVLILSAFTQSNADE